MTADPPYLRIARDIRHRIDSGDLAPGDRVPSTRRITQEWGVAMATATKALAALNQEGLVRAVPGVGTVVVEPVRERRAAPGQGLTRERVIRTATRSPTRKGSPRSPCGASRPSSGPPPWPCTGMSRARANSYG